MLALAQLYCPLANYQNYQCLKNFFLHIPLPAIATDVKPTLMLQKKECNNKSQDFDFSAALDKKLEEAVFKQKYLQEHQAELS